MLKSFKESIIEKAQALKRLRNASVEPHASDSRSVRMSIADANMNTEHLEPPRPGEVGALPSDINAEMQTPGTISQDPAIRVIQAAQANPKISGPVKWGGDKKETTEVDLGISKEELAKLKVFQRYEDKLLALRVFGSVIMCWDTLFKVAYYAYSRFASIEIK